MNPIQKFIQKILPSRIVEITSHEPPAIAQSLTVDRLDLILRDAEAGRTRDLFTLYRDGVLSDTHIQAEFLKRKLAVLGDELVVTPWDAENPDDVRAAEFCQALWADAGCEGDENDPWPDDSTDILGHLLDSTLWPVSVAERIVRPSEVPGRRFDIARFKPVPYHLLDWTEGRLRIEETNERGMPAGTFYDPDPSLHIIHRGHLLTSIPDHFGGPMRSLMFWWLCKVMDRGWWLRFLDRFGAPFPVAKYDQADDRTRKELQQAFSAAKKIFGLVVSRETDIQLLQANGTQTGDAFAALFNAANGEISKLILGQTMSTEAHAQGLGGGGGAAVHELSRGDIKQFDGRRLGRTLSLQVFAPLLRLNGISGRAPYATFGDDTESIETTSTVMDVLGKAGLELEDEGIEILSRRTGLPLRRKKAIAFPGLHLKRPPGKAGEDEADDEEGMDEDAALAILALAAGIDLDNDPRLILAARAAAPAARQLRAANAVIARVVREAGSVEAARRKLARLSLPAAIDIEPVLLAAAASTDPQ